jgi:hypothetical protein
MDFSSISANHSLAVQNIVCRSFFHFGGNGATVDVRFQRIYCFEVVRDSRINARLG